MKIDNGRKSKEERKGKLNNPECYIFKRAWQKTMKGKTKDRRRMKKKL